MFSQVLLVGMFLPIFVPLPIETPPSHWLIAGGETLPKRLGEAGNVLKLSMSQRARQLRTASAATGLPSARLKVARAKERKPSVKRGGTGQEALM
jgi:hypothetical protein